MKAFVIKIWLSLLIIALMTSTVVAKGIHIETNGKKHFLFFLEFLLPERLTILFKLLFAVVCLNTYFFA